MMTAAADDFGEIDPQTPLFFLSYARSRSSGRHGPRHGPNEAVIRFFEDLSEDVAQLISRPPGSDPGFMDRSMRGGVKWTDELLTAVGTSQVLVALLSDPFINSTWCGMEWHAFSQRPVRPRPGAKRDHQTGIIPVLWAPYPDDRTPKAVSEVQRFSPSGLPDPSISARYEMEGVLGLIRTGPESSYRALVWRLALRIADFLESHRVEPREFASDQLRNVFREEES